MNDILAALLLGAGIGAGLDALDTEKYLAGPAEMHVSVSRPIRRRNVFCHDPSDFIASVLVSQPLVSFAKDRVVITADFSHDSCLMEQHDLGTRDTIGLGVNIQLTFF